MLVFRLEPRPIKKSPSVAAPAPTKLTAPGILSSPMTHPRIYALMGSSSMMLLMRTGETKYMEIRMPAEPKKLEKRPRPSVR